MQKRLFYLFVILLYVSVAVAWGQGTGQAVASLDDECIREWTVLGPFFPSDLDRDFVTEMCGEADLDPRVDLFRLWVRQAHSVWE